MCVFKMTCFQTYDVLDKVGNGEFELVSTDRKLVNKRQLGYLM